MLKDIEVIVVDLQNIGARCYTYVSTLRYMLEKASEMAKCVIIADRPIPLPSVIDGPMLEPAYESFTGCVYTPMHYGMTLGEIALWLKPSLGLDLELKVAKMHGYTRQPKPESD